MTLYWQSVCAMALFFILSGAFLSSWDLMLDKTFISGIHFSLFSLLLLTTLPGTNRWQPRIKLCNFMGIFSLAAMTFSRMNFPTPFWLFFMCCSISSVLENRRLNQLLLFCSVKFLSDILMIAAFGILNTKRELVSLTLTILFLIADRFFEHKKVFHFYRVALILSFLSLCIFSFVFMDTGDGNIIMIDESHGNILSVTKDYTRNLDDSAPFGHANFKKALEKLGYTVRVNTDEITEESLKDVKCLVSVYPSEPYNNQSSVIIKKFVSRGGSFMAVGDHTNIDNCMDSLNPVIKNFGIRLNFDTVWTNKNNRRSLSYAHHPIFSGVDNVFLSVGGSLSVESPARPLLATYIDFWGDRGDQTNKSGGFLGNNVPEMLETKTDLALIAGAEYGKGRVVVFGDSAYFQNGSVFFNYKFIASLFSYLCSKSAVPFIGWIRFLSFCLSFYFMFFFLRYYGIEKILVNVPAVLFVTIMLMIVFSPDYSKLPQIMGPSALIDFSHNNSGQMYAFCYRSESDFYDSLPSEFLRSGITPFISDVPLDSVNLSQYTCIILQNPRAEFSKSEREALKDYVAGGGDILLIDGLYEKTSQTGLESLLGYSVAQSPLGVITPHRKDNVPISLPFGSYRLNFFDEKLAESTNMVNAVFPAELKGAVSPLAAYLSRFTVIGSVAIGSGEVIIITDRDIFSNGACISEGMVKNKDRLQLLWNIIDRMAEK